MVLADFAFAVDMVVEAGSSASFLSAVAEEVWEEHIAGNPGQNCSCCYINYSDYGRIDHPVGRYGPFVAGLLY